MGNIFWNTIWNTKKKVLLKKCGSTYTRPKRKSEIQFFTFSEDHIQKSKFDEKISLLDL